MFKHILMPLSNHVDDGFGAVGLEHFSLIYSAMAFCRVCFGDRAMGLVC